MRTPSPPTFYYPSGTFGMQTEKLQCLGAHSVVRPLHRLRDKAARFMDRLLAVVPPRRKTERLCAAIRTGNVEAVAACLQPGVRLSVPGKHGLPPLHMAAIATKNIAAAALLLDAGADIEARAYNATTPLIAAAANNRYLDVVVGLLARGADIDARQDCSCHRGWTALHVAAWANKNPAVMTALIDAGADINARTPRYGFTALHCVSGSGVRVAGPEHIAALISRGADVQARDDTGITALHLAVHQDNPAVVNALVAAGADIEAAIWTHGIRPLHIAVTSGHTAPVIAALIDAGADTSARTKAGAAKTVSAFGLGLQRGARARLTLGAYSKLSFRAPETECTPLRLALWCRNLGAIAALVNAGTAIEREDWPLLQAAVARDDAELFVALVGADFADVSLTTTLRTLRPGGAQSLRKSGVSASRRPHATMQFPLRPLATDKHLGTALHFAAAFGSGPRTITALIDAGCDVNSRDAKGETPLLSAVAYNPAPRLVVPALLNAGADVEATRGNNLTVLHVAIIRLPRLLAKLFNDQVNSWARAEGGLRSLLGVYNDANVRDCVDMPPLSYAAWLPHLVTILLKAGANPEAPTERGLTAMHFAAVAAEATNVSDILRSLLRSCNDVNVRDDFGMTPLHYAAAVATTEARLHALLAAGADLTATAENNATPLHLAATYNQTHKIVATLIRAGASTEVVDAQGNRPLHRAAQFNGNTAVVAALLAAGTDPDATGEHNAAPLHFAARFSETPAIDGGGADLEARTLPGFTALHAAIRGNAAHVVALINAGANVHARDSQGATPLCYAAGVSKDPAVIAALIDAGADIEDQSADGWRPLHIAAAANNARPVIAALIEAGANTGARAGQVRIGARDLRATPLHVAVVYKNCDAIAAFVDADVDLNVRAGEGDGWTPLQVAVTVNGPEMILALRGADADARFEYPSVSIRTGVVAKHYGTALHLAAANHAGTIAALGDVGATVEVRDTRGWTPLHVAAACNETPVAVTALIAAGADVDARTEHHGMTALHLAAASNRNPAVLAALVAAGAQVEAEAVQGLRPVHLARELNDASVVIALLNAGA